MKALNASYSKVLSPKSRQQLVPVVDRISRMSPEEVDDLLKKMAIGVSVGVGIGAIMLLESYLTSGR